MPLIKENIRLIFLITPHRIRTAIGKYQFHPCATRANVTYCISAFFRTMNICNSIWFKEVSRPLTAQLIVNQQFLSRSSIYSYCYIFHVIRSKVITYLSFFYIFWDFKLIPQSVCANSIVILRT